jgi:hypothetical protein
VQRGLVDDGSAEDGGAVGLAGDGEPLEPGGPVGSEVTVDADLVLHRSTVRSDLVSSRHHMW